MDSQSNSFWATKEKSQVKDASFITLVQIIGCLFVIYGHSYPFITEIPGAHKYIRDFIYSFHMPLFIWCSGYLFVYSRQAEKYSFRKFSTKRIQRLLIPYLGFSILGIVPKVLFSKYLNDDLRLKFIDLLRAFFVPRENIWGHFWFLPMLFFIGLVGFCISKIVSINRNRIFRFIRSEKTVWLFITVIAFCLSSKRLSFGGWFSINDIFRYYCFYSLGALCFYSELFSKHSHKIFNIWQITTVGSSLLAVLVFVLYQPNSHSGLIFKQNIIAILMIWVIVSICIKICNQGSKCKAIRSSIIGQTFQFFILSWPCQLFSEVILERILGMSFIIVHTAMLVAGVLGPLVLLLVIGRIESVLKTRIFSILLGK